MQGLQKYAKLSEVCKIMQMDAKVFQTLNTGAKLTKRKQLHIKRFYKV